MYVLPLPILLNASQNFHTLYRAQVIANISSFVMELIELAEVFDGEKIAPYEQPYLQDLHQRISRHVLSLEKEVAIEVFENWRSQVQKSTEQFQKIYQLLPQKVISHPLSDIEQRLQLWIVTAELKQAIADYKKGYGPIHAIVELFQIFKHIYLSNTMHTTCSWQAYALLSLAEVVIEQVSHTNNNFIQVVPGITHRP